MANVSTSRVDKLLSSMGYGSRNEIARIAKAGGITLDAAKLLDVTKRIPVTPDLAARMKIYWHGARSCRWSGYPFEQTFRNDMFAQGGRFTSI